MSPRAIVAGTGKMGRNIGGFLASKGWHVAWLSRDQARRDACERKMTRQCRDHAEHLSFHVLGETLPAALSTIDCMFESIAEAYGSKRALLEQLAAELPATFRSCRTPPRFCRASCTRAPSASISSIPSR